MKPDLTALRALDLHLVMERLGIRPVARYAHSVEYHLPDGRQISITSHPSNAKAGAQAMFQVWNGDSYRGGKPGGAGAIDLVMTITGQPFRNALGILAALNCRTAKTTETEPTLHLQTVHRTTLPDRTDEGLPAMLRYLCEMRKLPLYIVEPLVAREIIYAHVHCYRHEVTGTKRSFVNAVFVMRDDRSGQPAGSMIRGCYDGRTPRKSTLPFHNGSHAAFWIGEKLEDARTIVITESPIECLSWLAMHPDCSHLHCRTYGGARWRVVRDIFGTVKAAGATLICAFNNDREGNRSAEEFERLAETDGVSVTVDLPEDADDWNNSLRQNQR